MQKKLYFALAAIVLVGTGLLWYFFLRTGIAGEVYVASAEAKSASKPLANARIEIWQADSLIKTTHAGSDGEFAVRLRPGSYEARIHADGFLAAVFPNQNIARFKRLKLHVEMHQPAGRGVGGVVAQIIDSTSVIARRGQDDVWRTWKNTLTGTPHRMAGSAVALPQAPQSKEQAAKLAHQFLSKFVEENKKSNPALAKINLATLNAEPVRRFKDKWFVTFGQRVKNPFANDSLPVFGSEASVTISGKNVIQLGLDLFPAIEVSATKPPLSRDEAVAKFSKHARPEQADTANVRLVVFPVPKPADTTKFEYVLAYQLNVITRSNNPDQPLETWSYVVDAVTGRTLFRQSRSVVQVRASGRVKATIYEKSPEESRPATAPLPGGQIGSESLGFQNLDAGGAFRLPAAGSLSELKVMPSNTHFKLFDSGWFDLLLISWFRVVPENQLYQKSLADPDVTTSSSTGGASEVTLGLDPRPNTFHHLNLVRNFFIRHGIGDWLNTPLKVSFVQGYANAFYSSDNEQLVFGSVAEPLGLRSDVIYHEYTHGVVHWLVDRQGTPVPNALPYKDESGAMNEAFADYFACAINGDPEVRVAHPEHPAGKQVNRNLDNRFTYEKDFQIGEKDNGYVHDNSPIFSGMLWDLRQALIKKWGATRGGDIADELVLEALMLRPTPQTFADFSISLLLADDNDDRLFTGTPNYVAIKSAFEKHGIVIPVFEFKRPTLQNFRFTSSPLSPASHVEEGSVVTISAAIHESGYGLNPSSINLAINGNAVDQSLFALQGVGRMTQLRYVLNDRGPVRSKEFGASLNAKLAVKDLAGNETVGEISKPLKDTIKPKYELVKMERQGPNLAVTVRVTDNGSGINPASFVVRLDGKNISGIQQEKVSDYAYLLSVSYPCNTQAQMLYAEFADRSGNVTSLSQPLRGQCLSPCAFSGGAIFLAMTLMHYRRRRDSRNDGCDDTHILVP